MSLLKTVKLNQVENVAASTTATIRIPIGWMYHQVMLVLTNITAATINELRVIANGQTIMRGTGVEFDTLNQQLGFSAVSSAGVLLIPFKRLGLRDRALAEMTSLLTGQPYADGTVIQTLTIELDLDATASPSLVAYAEASAAVAGKQNWIKRQVPYVSDLSSGENQIDRLNKGGRMYKGLNRLMIGEAAAVLTELKINRDNYEAWDRTALLNDAFLANGHDNRAAVAGYFIFDSTEQGYGGNILDLEGISDFRLTAELASAQVGTRIIAEYLGALN